MALQRDSKFGYGFLLVGIAVPYLVDKFFGPTSASVAAATALIVGIIFLILGHNHGASLRRSLTMNVLMFSLYGAGLGALTGGIAGAVAHFRAETGAHSQENVPEKILPQITWQAPKPIFAGVSLSTAQLNATSGIDGTFVYAPDAGTMLTAGTHVLRVDFLPSDTAKYMPATKSVSLTVNPTPKPPPAKVTIPPAQPSPSTVINISPQVPEISRNAQ